LLIGRHTIAHLCRAFDVQVPEDLLAGEQTDPDQAAAVSGDQAAW
jgi:hypothetical protein